MAASESARRIVVYGGRGALGVKCVDHFKALKWWVLSIDMHENPKADNSIVIDVNDSLEEQERKIFTGMGSLGDAKLDAIFCVAGGWIGGNASTDLAKNMDRMWKQSVWSSTISAAVANKHLRDGGLLVLTGADAALKATPGNIGYGMAKAAVHHLVRSLAAKDSGMPADSCTTAILPITLDTPMNRRFMPLADFTSWTDLDYIADMFADWANNEKSRPTNGKLCTLSTIDSSTTIIPS